MKHLQMNRLACVIATALVTLLLTAHAVEAAPTGCGSWSVVTSPTAALNSQLSGVAAVSATSVWAVGYGGGTLVEHWNGTVWGIVPSPSPGGSNSHLFGVAAVSATDIWAVGYYYSSSNIAYALFEHWDGTSWRVVVGPNVGPNAQLYAVAAVSVTNVWAVGAYVDPSSGFAQTLIVHWDGASWRVVTSPNVGTNSNELSGVAAVSATSVWAVGSYTNSFGFAQTLVEQWNGASWNVIKSPNVGTKGNFLNSVAAVSGSSNVWAVGVYASSSGFFQTLIEQWNGASWRVVTSPNVGPKNNVLNSVTAISATNSWAAGYDYNSSGISQTLIEQWNGASWNVVTSPNVGPKGNFLNSVAAVSGSSNVWAVGAYVDPSSSNRTLTEFTC